MNNKKTIIGIFIFILVILISIGVYSMFFQKNNTVQNIAQSSSNEKKNNIQIQNTVVNNTVSKNQNIVSNKNNIATNNTTKPQNTIKNESTTPPTSSINTNTSTSTNTNTSTSASSNKNTSTNPEVSLAPGIFSSYYTKASNKLKTLTLDERIGQLFLVGYPGNNAKDILKQYKLGGYLFFEKDFRGKTQTQVKSMMKGLQSSANIPILTAVDEEGGTVVRVSSNPNLAKSKFKSPSELYKAGKFDKIKQDTIEKSKLLSNLGINLNLAPVVDVSTNPNDFMYQRSLGKNSNLTSTYAKTVINASKGYNVSYTLKHFPGYGNNIDTHTGSAVDKRSYNDIVKNDLPPFSAGIKAGAEAVLVSHNIVTSIDKNNPASLSKKVHNVLRNDLNFTGIIITDDLNMGAVSQDANATVKAILAGNDLIIVADCKSSISSVKKALKNGKLSEKSINEAAMRVLAWKYYKGLM